MNDKKDSEAETRKVAPFKNKPDDTSSQSALSKHLEVLRKQKTKSE